MEDKSLICNLLMLSLQETEELRELMSLSYDRKCGLVYAGFRNGYIKEIAVSSDTGTGLIKEIVNAIC